MATTPQQPPKSADQRHPATNPAQRPNQPQGTAQQRPVQQPQDPQRKQEEQSRQKSVDPKEGRDPDSPSGVAADYDTKPKDDEHGGDQSAHPSPATDPTNAPPEPTMWTDDNPRPPLPRGRDYVAGQPVTQEEYELTEKEQAERVRPEAWKRAESQGVEVEEGMKDASSGWDEEAKKKAEKSESKNKEVGWDRDKEGTRPDARALRSAETKDDDVNKAPGGAGGQGTRADGRARSPDMPGEGPNDRGERVESREARHSQHEDL